jgi:sigma-B regulation protein RsbU (phosphoserine phosphatase)
VVERSTADLHELAREALDDLRASHPGRLIEHHAIGDGTCACDPGRIAQIIDNLGANAVAYGTSDRPVTVTTGGDDPHVAEVRVHNHGAPIPADMIDRIFEPFERATRESGGRRSLGLGLYIIRHLARAHGGDVDVESTAERGTTFRVRIPRR